MQKPMNSYIILTASEFGLAEAIMDISIYKTMQNLGYKGPDNEIIKYTTKIQKIIQDIPVLSDEEDLPIPAIQKLSLCNVGDFEFNVINQFIPLKQTPIIKIVALDMLKNLSNSMLIEFLLKQQVITDPVVLNILGIANNLILSFAGFQALKINMNPFELTKTIYFGYKNAQHVISMHSVTETLNDNDAQELLHKNHTQDILQNEL
jgi:hypothetical protein